MTEKMRPQKVIIHNTESDDLMFAMLAAKHLMEEPDEKEAGMTWGCTKYRAFAVRNTKSISVWGQYPGEAYE